MELPDRTDWKPTLLSVARCRELLGDEARTLSDEEVLDVARHAETLAHIVIDFAVSGRSPEVGHV